MRIGKQELTDRLAQEMKEKHNIPVTKAASKVVVDCMFDILRQAMLDRDEVVIPDFGSFKVQTVKPRIGRNVKKGTEVQIPARQRVKFTPGKELKTTIDITAKL